MSVCRTHVRYLCSDCNRRTINSQMMMMTITMIMLITYLLTYLHDVSGAMGFTGGPGPAGATGSTGIQGVPGYTGSRGFTGLPGNAGPRGTPGFPGPQGILGATGATGGLFIFYYRILLLMFLWRRHLL